MFESPYRPCPMCRTHLKSIEEEKQKQADPKYKGYVCGNCGSEVWVLPFARIKEV